MKRVVLVALGVLLALVLAAPAALAQSRGGAPAPVDETPIDLEPGDVYGNCAFPIRLEYSGKAKVIRLSETRSIATSPGLTATLTNLDTDKQVTLSITGAFHETTLANGDVVTKVTGRNLLGDPEAGFVLAIGDFSYVFDKQDTLVQPLSGEGQLVDICGLLS